MTNVVRLIMRKYNEHIRVWGFLSSILLVGIGIGFSISFTLTKDFAEQRFAAYDRQIARLNNELDVENKVDRENLDKLIERVGQNADLLFTLSKKAESTSKTARSAAKDIRSAVKTVKERRQPVVPKPAPKVKPNYPHQEPTK